MNKTPPNIKALDTVLRITQHANREDVYSMLVCPECNFEHTNIGEPRKVSGNDNYEAWRGRGDLLVIPFFGQCGSEWEICFGFHKGNTDAFIRVKKSCAEESFLYFIEAVNTGFIKIGRSANPERRLLQLSTGSPNELVLVGKVSGGSTVESDIHGKFMHLRNRGEWFQYSSELKEFIKEAIA